MKCYDFKVTAECKISGWVWADNPKEVEKLIKSNEVNLNDNVKIIGWLKNLKIKEDESLGDQ